MRPQPEMLSPAPVAMSEQLVQAAVQAGLDAVRHHLAPATMNPEQATRLARIVAVSEEWENELVPVAGRGARRLRPIIAVVGFDAPSAEGTGHVPWFAD